MDDKQAMENILLTTKGACDLYMHGTIESSDDAKVHQAFDKALEETLVMQDQVYKAMTAKGWYTTQQAEEQKKEQVKQKFSSSVSI